MAQTDARKRKTSTGNGNSPAQRKSRARAGVSNGDSPAKRMSPKRASAADGGSPSKAARSGGSKRPVSKGAGLSPVAKAKKASPPLKKATKPVAAQAQKAKRATAKKGTSIVPSLGGSSLARRLAMRMLKRLAGKMLESGAQSLREAVVRVAEESRDVVQRVADESRDVVQRTRAPRLPIQCSIDVAVPVHVAWEEWMNLEVIPEGVHRVHDIERDGDELAGTIDAAGQPEWRAEVLDERDDESFAWRSLDGSDCAGLITFHRLSDRLTRVELNLDVLPTSPAEAVTLTAHLAHHRAETDLRRFKALVELISPELYE